MSPSFPVATWRLKGSRVAIGDWAEGLACVHCGGAELEVLTWNGVIDTGYGSAKAERTVLLRSGEGSC